jgi:hypothetical protein
VSAPRNSELDVKHCSEACLRGKAMSLAFRVFIWKPSSRGTYFEHKTFSWKMYSDFECICSQKCVQCYFTYRTGAVTEFYRQFCYICRSLYVNDRYFLIWRLPTHLWSPHGGPEMIVCVVSPLMVLTFLTASYEHPQLDNLLTKKPAVYAFRDVGWLRRGWNHDLTKIHICL